ncbi:DUF397 domain-containing protein [Streptomyces sp. NBC_01795]|uniref:DUF397 domain-containing protein n=1 Tax=unclassified Streptomyces TaxID=2593676 RepID=UPI002DDBFD77|nr:MULTISPECIES: DUF397 domain-containing protein [unclassified Streptomyces]WSA92442.1 DUF397 domain-containing protein [Streptomyces sp. NBC_01795]WSB76808.1 DUF397 domain-containing protein [Streptomyces sp. NBC_01775]
MSERETATAWVKSSRSDGQGNCVEVALLGSEVAARDTKDRERATLSFSPPQWQAFIRSTALGQFDRM